MQRQHSRRYSFAILAVALGSGTIATAETGSPPAAAEHVVVYYEPGRFAGWPANNGIWSWGDEILVGFKVGGYEERERGHSIADAPSEVVQARSLDGGRTWSLERPPGLTGQERVDAAPSPGGIRFDESGFAMKLRWQHFQVSYDRGRSWSPPFALPDFGQSKIMARTDYVVTAPDECTIFLTAEKRNGREGRPFTARIGGGGDSIDFVSWIGPEPEGYSIMPSTVRLGPRALLSAIRRYERGEVNRGFIEMYASDDGGESWSPRGVAAETGERSGNPPSLVRLEDGRVVVTYGNRSQPLGVRARVSHDEGSTWGPEIRLRDDTRTWDFGYTRSVQRPDGKIVTVYYHTDEEMREQHIAATIWDPGRALDATASVPRRSPTRY